MSMVYKKSKSQFISEIAALAVNDMRKNSIFASVTIAQAILESGYGNTDLAIEANNIFGMKCVLSGNKWSGSTWDGISKYTKKTQEDDGNGNLYYVIADFRKYESVSDSIGDHSAYLLGAMNGAKKRYEGLKEAKTPEEAIKIIKNGGYATDTSYVDKILKIIADNGLTKYDTIKEEKTMSNSSLVSYTKLSPNHSGQRTHSIDRITPHCVVGQLSAESICGCFTSTSRQASCNYGIGTDGRISLCVEEKNRSWCSSSNANDQRAVTIECASDTTEPYAMNSKVYASLINLCVDICKRNGKKKLLWFGDKNKTLNYSPKSDEMVLTVHRWFANKSCPGDWLYSRLGDLATQVTNKLGGSIASNTTPATTNTKFPTTPFTVQVLISDLNYRSAGSMSDKVLGQTGKGTFTITEVKNGWGKLKSGAGWIYLENASYVKIGSTVNNSSSTPASGFTSYKVKVTADVLNIRKGPGTNYGTNGSIRDKGVYTIVDEASGQGATKWGKLKSGAGWISLDYATRI